MSIDHSTELELALTKLREVIARGGPKTSLKERADASERLAKLRQEIAARVGVVDFAVPSIREMRGGYGE